MLRGLLLLIAVSVAFSANAQQEKKGTEDPPTVVTRVNPIYPKPFPKDSAEGAVFIQMTVDGNGDVTSASVMKSEVGATLQQAAIDAAKQWKFAPNPKSKNYTLVLPFRFKLSSGKKEEPVK